MSDTVARRIGTLTLEIDRTLCVGFGDCMEVAPDLLEFDDDGICAFRAEAPEVERDRLIQTCEICPVDALTLREEDGTQLVP
jgi:ferredoxin